MCANIKQTFFYIKLHVNIKLVMKYKTSYE